VIPSGQLKDEDGELQVNGEICGAVIDKRKTANWMSDNSDLILIAYLAICKGTG
jgi:hypothetical protein